MKREREGGVADGGEKRNRAPPRKELYEIFSVSSHPPPVSTDFFTSPASSRQVPYREITTSSKSMPGRENLNLGFMRMPSAADNLQSQNETATAPSSISGVDETELVGKSEDVSSSRGDRRNELFTNDKSESVEDCSIDDDNNDVSPDNLVSLIGAKHFWKLRRAIADQQRVFKLQVFELHRLMKVQELLSGSPDVLLESITPLKTAEEEDLSERGPPPWYFPEMPPVERLIYNPHSTAPGCQPQISAEQVSNGSEVDQLRVDSWSSRNEENPKSRHFTNSTCDGSSLHVEPDCLTSLPRVYPLEFPVRLTSLPGVSLPIASQERSVPWTPLPSFLADSGYCTNLPRVSPLQGSRSFTPLPKISPPEGSDPWSQQQEFFNA